MAYRVAPAVHRVQATGCHTAVDRAVAQPQRHQLHAPDNSVLALGQRRDQLVDRTRVTLTTYMGVNVTLVAHGADGALAFAACDAAKVKS
jgi:hypothetical protein